MTDINQEIEEVEESQEETNQSAENTESTENQEAEAEEETQERPREWVELDEKQQKKFNDLYKQVKMSDARNQLKDQMLEKAMSKIEELERRFSQTDQAEAERILKEQIQEARDAGDLDKEVKLFKELAAFEKAAPQKETKQPTLNDPDEKYLLALGQETDDSGELLRPWLANTHPQHRAMLTKAQIIVAELEADGIEPTVPQVMKILDNRMKKTPASRAPSPLERGNLTISKNGANIKPKLSDAEKAMARKLGMSEADYLDGKVTYGGKK